MPQTLYQLVASVTPTHTPDLEDVVRDHPDWSDRQIAELARVSKNSVNEYRQINQCQRYTPIPWTVQDKTVLAICAICRLPTITIANMLGRPSEATKAMRFNQSVCGQPLKTKNSNGPGSIWQPWEEKALLLLGTCGLWPSSYFNLFGRSKVSCQNKYQRLRRFKQGVHH